MAIEYVKASDTAIKYSKDVIIEVSTLKHQKMALESRIASMTERLAVVNAQLAEADRLGVT